MSNRKPIADADLEMLQHVSFSYFLHETNPENGLVIDKTAADWPASIAATGFALAAYPVAVERGFMPRAAAIERTLTTLRFFWNSPQGPEPDALYGLLEREVIPEFYTRDENGIPTAWVKRMRESMARLTPRFSANRTVCEYAEQHYLPAATAYRERTANKGAVGQQMADWQHRLDQKWPALHFGEVKVETRGEQHVFEVQVHLNDLDPEAVQVELYADGVMDGSPVRQEMTRVRQLSGAPDVYVYSATVSADRPAADYTARVMPHCGGVAIPLEDARILWGR